MLGQFVQVRDVVRVLGVPSLDGMAPAAREESEPVFARLVGRAVRVDEIDDRGLLGVWFSTRERRHRQAHWVALEPWLVRVRRLARLPVTHLLDRQRDPDRYDSPLSPGHAAPCSRQTADSAGVSSEGGIPRPDSTSLAAA